MMQNDKIDPKTVLKNVADIYRMELMPEENTKWLHHAFEVDEVWDDNLNEREDKEVSLARLYANEFAHGTAGHNQYMLIAKLSDMLDVYESALHSLIEYVETGRVD